MRHIKDDAVLDKFRLRLVVAAGLVLLCFVLLLARLVWLQVVQYAYYQTRAEDNRISLVPITPSRGLIVDRNNRVLANNYPAYTLEIIPAQTENIGHTIDQLAELIDIQPGDRKRFKKLLAEGKRIESIPIRTQLNDEEVARFIAQRYRFPGVDVKARLFRHYPGGAFASAALGYIGRVTDRDLDRIEDADQEANYRGTHYIGKMGLEERYEFALHGITGFEQLEVDSAGRAVRTLSRTAPVPGNNLTLTLDAELQRIAEQAFGARRGALVAIEPATGGILALVSMPNYDPNLFVDGIDSASWKDLNESADRPMLNRAINGVYPPGSTFKPFMALAALAYGKRTPEQAIYDPGVYQFGGHTFRDDKKGGHGSVDMYRSIVESCDTYYYMLANDLGIDRIARFMGQFGLGSRTGIDLSNESVGVLPSPAWKESRFKQAEQKKWYAGETISIGIGQGYNAYTPIQLAQAVATLANDGVMFRPHLVKFITDTRTGKRELIEPKPIKTIALNPEHIKIIKAAMVGVNIEGTGARVFAGAGYTSAGKTGTAQVFSLKGAEYKKHSIHEILHDHALFIAFAPAENPKIALAVIVENGGFGAQAAAPIARQMFDYYLLGKKPSAPAPVVLVEGGVD
jgi:penicillin-binding protein 2